MKVELRKLSDIKPYPGNPRHNDQAVDAVAASIKTFGFRQPIVVDEQGEIVVGDTRYKAALKLGLETAPVHVATGLTPDQVKAYRIADNKTGELASWNQDLLLQEILNLQQQNCDLAMTGFSTEELSQLLDTGSPDSHGDPDDIPQPPDKPITQPGELWILGEHRLVCGDAGESDDVDRLLAGAKVAIDSSGQTMPPMFGRFRRSTLMR